MGEDTRLMWERVRGWLAEHPVVAIPAWLLLVAVVLAGGWEFAAWVTDSPGEAAPGVYRVTVVETNIVKRSGAPARVVVTQRVRVVRTRTATRSVTGRAELRTVTRMERTKQLVPVVRKHVVTLEAKPTTVTVRGKQVIVSHTVTANDHSPQLARAVTVKGQPVTVTRAVTRRSAAPPARTVTASNTKTETQLQTVTENRTDTQVVNQTQTVTRTETRDGRTVTRTTTTPPETVTAPPQTVTAPPETVTITRTQTETQPVTQPVTITVTTKK